MIACSLLAKIENPADRLREMSRHLQSRQGDTTLWWGLLGVASLGAGLYAALLLFQWYQHRDKNRHQLHAKRLFRDVLQSLGLPLADRVTLRRVARGLHLAHPTSILISPSTLRWAAGQWERKRRNVRLGNVNDTERLVDISRRVFGHAFVPMDLTDTEPIPDELTDEQDRTVDVEDPPDRSR